jgi:hypothetical protein
MYIKFIEPHCGIVEYDIVRVHNKGGFEKLTDSDRNMFKGVGLYRIIYIKDQSMFQYTKLSKMCLDVIVGNITKYLKFLEGDVSED